MKFCKNCNKAISENFKHCPDCGNKLSHIVKDQDKPKNDSRKTIEFDLFAKKTIFAIIIVAVAIIAIGFTVANQIGSIPKVNSTETTTTTTASAISTISTTTTEIPKFDISIKVVNEYTKEPIESAIIYLDGSDIGVTGQYGTKAIQNVLKGSHNLEVKYKDIISRTQIDVSSANNFEVTIKAPVDVMLTVKDTETKKVVDFVKISLEDRSGKSIITDTTTQMGTVLAKDVIPGDYRIGVHLIEQGQEKVIYSDYKKIGLEDQAAIEVNMPNPILNIIDTNVEKIIWCSVKTHGLCSRLNVKVTVMNSGNEEAKNVFAIVSVYNVDENKQPAGNPYSQEAIRFDYIPTQTPESNSVIELDRTILKDQKVIVVLFDTSKYSLPKDISNIVSSDRNRAAEILDETLEYCQHNFSNCVSEFAKAVSAVAPLVTAGA